MSIQPEIKKAETLSGITFTAKNAVECKVGIKEEETAEEIYTSGRVSLNYIDCQKNEVRYGGKVIFNVAYGSNQLKKAEAGVEFSYKTEVEGVREGDLLTYDVWLENVKLSVINGLPTITGAVVLKGNVEKQVEFEYLRQCDGVNLKKEETENALICANETKTFTIEEEFDTNTIISEVLCHNETVKILGVLSGIGAVAVSGEIELSMVILPIEGAPVFHKQVVPFRLEHEIQKAMPDLISLANACLNDATLKIVVDKNKDKSTIFLRAEISLSTRLYENRNLAFNVDAYCINKELNLEKITKKFTKTRGQRYCESKVSMGGISKSYENSRLIAPLFAKIEQIELKNNLCEIEIDGVVETNLLMQGENGYFIERSNIPFNIKDNTDCNKIDISTCAVTDLTACEENGNLLISFNLSYLLEEREENSFTMLSGVIEGEDKVVNNSAISVCIPSADDTLWELSKALGVTEEEILKLNPELTFPLTGEERVVVYREIK